MGYMDIEGNLVIEPRYYQALEFSEGLACVETWGKQGYINTKGEWIWKPTPLNSNFIQPNINNSLCRTIF
ncbi:MAG: WG repeat-containing protein [Candidatus Dadabacteria bacterium]|nr:WG repeat-containing protein [Candidatus Dadabacteria bacterium]NIS08304.1 WG repeat-containing protein [Candidatus Dadabacteria bacterium]NIV41652.1 hypothetical protein [Candidatus Dadabacteria bacterium]NIY21823.1 hypothetical protein [Candidatus Dadabacteria bacterium]